MHLKLQKSEVSSGFNIAITGSKSESNRLLLLKALYPKLEIENLSNSDDTQLMKSALQGNYEIIDVHHAGTAMRFLTAYLAVQNNREVIITGSERMKERPIKILVDALRTLGAEITYLEKEGYPPLKIKGKTISESEIALTANQYISALLLVAPSLKNGLKLKLEEGITSKPYVEMTLSLLNQIGVKTNFQNNVITVLPLKTLERQTNIKVESDWSSASYFYSIIALSDVGTSVKLSYYKKDSLQGDSALARIYKSFGVDTIFETDGMIIQKISENQPSQAINLNLIHTPDIAQTIAVTCLGLKQSCVLTGLHTLKIKETDRLQALKNELEKFGAKVSITENSLELNPKMESKKTPIIQTYNDHRMAMAFAPLALKTPMVIQHPEVVSKSYPDFWSHLKCLGFKFEE